MQTDERNFFTRAEPSDMDATCGKVKEEQHQEVGDNRVSGFGQSVTLFIRNRLNADGNLEPRASFERLARTNQIVDTAASTQFEIWVAMVVAKVRSKPVP